MSLVTELLNAMTRIGTEFKTIKTYISGSGTGNVSGLETTATNLVAAINELHGEIGAGGANALDDLTDVAITTPATGHILRHNGTLFVNVPGTDHFQPLSSALTAVASHVTVTQAVDLDAIEARVNQLDAAVVLSGTWNASVGTFPGGGTAQAGQSWIVSVGGTVNGQVFAANDRIVAIADNASTTVYAANWHKLDYTDQVLSVVGQTGAVTIAQILTALLAVDGAGSGLDADTVDGIQASAFATTANMGDHTTNFVTTFETALT